ncbi:hypothetical protein QJQ45_022259, partial [Haematococcus lacustris]
PESQMEPGGPLPPQPPELTARYNKKLLTLEEISKAHASSVYAQKYNIEVVGGKIKAVCNDCKMVLSCGNLSDSRKHQCNKRPRSDQHAIAGGTSSDMLFERITACWNPDQRMPANIVTEFWRRLHMWFIDAEIPFAKVDNPWLRDALTLAGIGMMSERSLLTSQLLLRYQEVQGKVAKQVAELETVAMGVSDGYKNKYAQLGASLMDFSSLLPDGGRIFHDVKDVSDLKKDAVGIKDLLQSWPDELRSAGHPVPAIKGWVMDNTSANKRAMQLMEDDDPEAINMGCADSPGTPANAEPTRLGFLLAPAATTAVAAVARPTLPTLPWSKLRAPYVSQLLGEVAQISLVLGDCSAIRWGLFKQQQQRLQPQKTVRARDPTRFSNNVSMAQDVLELHDSLRGLVESEEWPELKKASRNSDVFDNLMRPEWWKLLRAVIKLLKPLCDFTHKLEADTPYLTQLLPIWHTLLKVMHAHALPCLQPHTQAMLNPARAVQDAEEWVLEVSRDNPQWTLGVMDLLRERRAKGYWPVMPAAYVLDGVNFAPPKDKLNAPPQPPFGLLSPQEKEDAITTVVRLSKHLRPDLTDSQVKQAVQREVDVLQLGGWGDSELERFAALLAPKPPDAAGRVVVEQVSMRRAFWSKAGLRGFPHLAVAASRLLGVHATSAASERNWSAWGRLFTSARTRLTLERAKMLIYIKANAGLGARRSNEAQLLARMGE